MAGKGRFGSFIPGKQEAEKARPQEVREALSKQAIGVETPEVSLIPVAPVREEKRAFSTRVRPSQKAMLDGYVMELKRAGWPVSQEAVLEELLKALQSDPVFRAAITARLTRGAE